MGWIYHFRRPNVEGGSPFVHFARPPSVIRALGSLDPALKVTSVVPADQERGECGEHRGRTGEPHTRAHPRRRRQLVRAPHGAAAGHSGRPAAGAAAWQQGVGRAQLQQGATAAQACTRDSPRDTPTPASRGDTTAHSSSLPLILLFSFQLQKRERTCRAYIQVPSPPHQLSCSAPLPIPNHTHASMLIV